MRPLISYNRKSQHSVSFSVIIAIAFFGHLHECGKYNKISVSQGFHIGLYM